MKVTGLDPGKTTSDLPAARQQLELFKISQNREMGVMRTQNNKSFQLAT
jgi:hypothetical protein